MLRLLNRFNVNLRHLKLLNPSQKFYFGTSFKIFKKMFHFYRKKCFLTIKKNVLHRITNYIPKRTRSGVFNLISFLFHFFWRPVRFTTVPLSIVCSSTNQILIFFFLKTVNFHLRVLFESDLHISCLKETMQKVTEINFSSQKIQL